MSTTRTEVLGISMLIQDIYESEFLEPYIDVNDKTPSWDGNIFVYENIKHSKEFLMGKIPVQVKSSMVSELGGVDIQFQVSKTDLVNYKNDGGVLFLLIQMDNKRNHKVYYATLLPFDLQRYLEGMKKATQKSVDVTLYALESGSGEHIHLLCKNFLINKRMQSPMYNCKKTINDFKKVTFTVASKPDRLDEYILHNPIYIYGGNDDISIPIEKVNVDTIAKEFSQEVRVGSCIYYSGYECIRSKDQDLIKIGKGITAEITNNRIKFIAKGTLNERITEFKLIRDVIGGEILYLGNIPLPVIQTGDAEREALLSYLKYLQDITRLLQYFNINEDLMMDELTEKDYDSLNGLIGTILYNQKGKIKDVTNGVGNFKLGNLNISLLVEEGSDGNSILENYFSDAYKKLSCKIQVNDTLEEYETSPYTNLKAEDIASSSNLDLSVIEESIKEIKPTVEAQLAHINILLLELIKAYDMKNSLIACLDTAMNLFLWLEELGEDDVIVKLNKLQIIKRQRKLNDAEIEFLLERRKNEEEIANLCGISILLDNRIDFDYYFKKLPTEQQEDFKGYPIFSLLNQN